MRLIIGAPVANRAWAIPKWMECLKAQTIKPDGFVFVYSLSQDATLPALHRNVFAEMELEWDPRRFIPRDKRNVDRCLAFTQLAYQRNRLLEGAQKMGADVFLSLDTDVFLTDPTAIEQMLDALDPSRDVFLSSCVTYLAPTGAESDCFNAAFWSVSDRHDDSQRPWERVTRAEFDAANGAPLGIDIPMAVVMMSREVLENCQYVYHERGEDAGFAQDLDRMEYQTAWLTRLEAPHVMDPRTLDSMIP
jgi:hypothetical protein